MVVHVGRGRIPVIEDSGGGLRGTAGVIDKDYTCALLTTTIGGDLLLISTAVENGAVDYSRPNRVWLDEMTLADARG